MRFYTYITVLFVLALSVSCKKQVDAPEKPEVEKPERKSDELLKDSVYYYYKLYSLWESSITKYDPIASFTDPFKSPQEVLNSLKSQTPFNSVYNGAVDKFTYFTDLDKQSGASARFKMDKNDGYGIYFSIGAIDAVTAYPIIKFVEGGSSAAIAGVQRSDMVLELNGVDMKIDVVCDANGCKAKDGQKFESIRSLLNTSLTGNSLKLKVEKNDNIIKTYDLTYGQYEIDPLAVDTIFTISNNKIGYFMYSSFEEIKSNNNNQSKIDELFNEFSTKQIKNLIVDLRYNGGGYVDAATYLADKIINSAGDGKLMLTYELNANLSRGKNSSNSSFKDVYFKRKNNLELQTVCFIVSENTASAAELLINVLKPYMNVRIIAEGTHTYGKPVGFFPTEIMSKIELWVTSFKLLNAKGETDYWGGLSADKSNVQDYIFRDFGDKKENLIAAALDYMGFADNSLKAQQRLRSIPVQKVNMGVVNEIEHKGAIK